MNYSTQNGTAIAGTDYVSTSGTLHFVSSQATNTIAVPVIGNTILQPNRTFSVNLSQPTLDASFASQATFATGSGPFGMTAADINGDGKSDILIANFSAGTVSVLVNTTAPGENTPTFLAQQTFATGNGPISVIAKDVNGDGRPDLVVANDVGNDLSVLMNTTAPGATACTFSAQQTFATAVSPAYNNNTIITIMHTAMQ